MPLSKAEIDFYNNLNNFAEKLKQAYSESGTLKGNPEDQLKRPIRELIESIYSGQIKTRTETQVEGLGARPDIGISVQNLLAGHIELKAPGLGANTNKFKGANRKQWQKFSSLPNLIYTDGTEWILYREGERVSPIIRFNGDVIDEGKKAVSEDDAVKFYALLTDFLNWD
ncbi:MAG: DNA methyltransferase, partial [Candidatus Paceibacterota bacterium]